MAISNSHWNKQSALLSLTSGLLQFFLTGGLVAGLVAGRAARCVLFAAGIDCLSVDACDDG